MEKTHVWHPLTQHEAFIEGRGPLVITGGRGSTVYSRDGQEFLDAASGLWCVNVGYGREELADAGSRQLHELAYYPLTQSHPRAVELSERISEYLPNNPYIYFSNSGSEANEVAFKVVRQFWGQRGKPGKYKILSRHRGYHGSTMGALAASGQSERRRGYEPLAPGFIQVAQPYCYRCPFNTTYPECHLQCADDIERRLEYEGPDTVAAIIVEPVTAGGGVLVPPLPYLARVQAIARQYDVTFIVDEVVTAFGRLGSMFAVTQFGIQPDVITMAKGLASGYMPIAATAFSRELFDGFRGDIDSGRHLRHVNTFGGHPVAAAVALANIDVLESEGLAERSARLGETLLRWIRESLSDVPIVGDIRGMGLFIGIELVSDRETKQPVDDRMMRAVTRHALQLGVILGKTTDVEYQRNNTLILAPPLVITEPEMERLVMVLHESIVTTMNSPVA